MTSEAASDTDLAQTAATILRGIGQRVTKPRVAVLSRVIAAGSEHVSADTIFDGVTAHDTDVHRATVYRTLESLTDAGVLRHVHLDRGLRAYHLAETAQTSGRAQHLHAQCARCGLVVDLPPGVLGGTGQRIRAATGFHLDASHAALSGLCENCAAIPL
ncbi:MAG TPA: Fur family transcriptional regulator [Mycobacteriales bacterium]